MDQIETTPVVPETPAPETTGNCTHPACRGKCVPAPYAFIRGDWAVQPSCSKHATADKDGKPWPLDRAQAAAAQYRRVQAEFQDRIKANRKTAKPVLTKVAPPAPPDPNLVLLKTILEVVGRANAMEVRTQQAALAIMNGRGQYCTGGRQRGFILIRGRDGEKSVFPVDGDHWRGAHRLRHLTRAAGGHLGLFVFADEAEMVEFEKRRQQPREPRSGASKMDFGAATGGVGSSKARLDRKPTAPDRGPTKASVEARERNHETAVATELAAKTGTSVFEAMEELGIKEPAPEAVSPTDPGVEAQLAAINAKFGHKSEPQPQKGNGKGKKPNSKAARRQAATN